MNKKIRFDEIEFNHSTFYGEDGFDIHLSVKFSRQFEDLFDIEGSHRYPVVRVSCSADGEILDITFDDGTYKFELIELTIEEQSDIRFFLAKHNTVFEEAEQNEFPIGRYA